ncbi:hypothetical protein [Streptomyces sp. NPDC089795]
MSVMTAIDANSSIAKIDVAIKAVTEQRSGPRLFRQQVQDV